MSDPILLEIHPWILKALANGTLEAYGKKGIVIVAEGSNWEPYWGEGRVAR